MKGILTDDGLAGMLGAADVKKLDIKSTFIPVLLHLLCGESEICPVKKLFTHYVDVMNEVCGHKGREKWTAVDISKL